jgi:hypothetical protein
MVNVGSDEHTGVAYFTGLSLQIRFVVEGYSSISLQGQTRPCHPVHPKVTETCYDLAEDKAAHD